MRFACRTRSFCRRREGGAPVAPSVPKEHVIKLENLEGLPKELVEKRRREFNWFF